jgi:ATP-dependent DNA helicase RecG
MNSSEKQNIEYKSLQKIRTGDKGFRDLSVTCVALANAQGGQIYIGYDDQKRQPLPGQTISQDEANNAVTKLRGLCFNVGISVSEILADNNGSQYFVINVYSSINSFATTSDGKMYIRVADKCEPVRSEDIQRISEEKGAYQWELVKTQFKVDADALHNLKAFADDIRGSKRVKEHIKQMDDKEIAENYHLIDEDYLTNLGVIWLGSAKQRSKICYPITVEYIVYDELERKTDKREWRDNTLNPKELLTDIMEKATELNYTHEIPDGLFRKQIRYYNENLIRELLVNALAHKSNTISNEITIAVYKDHLEISNPGGLPLGVTKDNILHTKHRRNPNMIEILSALGMMEGEGSGYDLIYELNASESKQQPTIESTFNTVTVSQSAEIIDKEVIPLMDYVGYNYQLSQKNKIAFGIIAREKRIGAPQLSKELQLADEERLRSYMFRLIKEGLIIKSGVKKGTSFCINPQLIRNAKANITTSLKTLEPHVLKALIIEDIRRHPKSKIAEISERIIDVDLKEIRKIVYSMVDKELVKEGSRTDSRYSLK